ncbi:beta-glucosidase [Cladophialophora psammophila CBS 110553]|uniref:Probable beta-glucosidase G n=1 Tax=Cladophialophora psammophila CBS 110553 TaxID=1182543 RepID=W9WLP0_9EURO|nr:beta-glucosidase [Cladophialophora psammophila CBS 110553]EXJ65900.1 beta-glucosidase [Cladophialophora psammophila CBS 110553]
MLLVTLWSSLLALTAQGVAQDYGTSPPVYPSPPSTGIGWEVAFTQAQAFVSNLTLEEKAQLVTGTEGPCVGNIGGIPRVGFDGLCLQDGPLAIRQATYASVFPAGLTAAASWDRGLIYLRGLFLGAEFKGKGSHVALGPVVGPLGRSAYGGRGWESFSPDPYLTGVAAENTIWGMQRSGVQACLKHYIGNEQETHRNPALSPNGTTIEAVSSNIDDRTMHELYLWPFAHGVRAGTASIMCSYNRLNGSYGCQNSKTLNGLLKTELGFQGYVMSDWQATHAGVHAIKAGLDMDMPGSIGGLQNTSFFGGNVTRAIKNGTLDQDRLDDMARRIMTPYFYLNQNEYPPVDKTEPTLNSNYPPYDHPFTFGASNVDVRNGHGQLIRDIAAAGTVLLKNTNDALPLKAPKTLGVFGNDAGDLVNGQYFLTSAFQNPFGYEYGTLPIAGGSGTGRLSYLVSPLEALKARAALDGTLVQYILNNNLLTQPSGLGAIVPVPEVCLVFLKSWASEGSDRASLEADWDSSAVVSSVAAYCNNTVVITHSAGLNVMPWANNPNVTAILAAHLPGQESGNAIVDILYGTVNPSGKLPYTIALSESDYRFSDITNSTKLLETEDPNAWQSNFTEGLLIDYRHFDYYNKSVLYEFGFGLSYTTFDMFDLSTDMPNTTINPLPDSLPIAPGGNPSLWQIACTVNVTVMNTGDVAGAAVPQLYLSFPPIPSPMPTPLNVLRGFDKIWLEPSESQTASFLLTRRDLSYWNVETQEWVIPIGAFEVTVGFSSRDLWLKGQLTVTERD